jgi:hypothetical protein
MSTWDLVYLLLTLVLTALTVGLVRLFEHLEGRS